MDRREALKKLAAGTALTLASPLIVKSTAFADSGTASCLPTNFASLTSIASSFTVAAAGTPAFARLDFSPGALASCPSPYDQLIQYRWTNVSSTAPANTAFLRNNGAWGNSTAVRLLSSQGPDVLALDGAYQIRLEVRVACRTTTRVCWRCVTLNLDFEWAGSSVAPGTVSPSAAFDPDSTNCADQPPGPLP